MKAVSNVCQINKPKLLLLLASLALVTACATTPLAVSQTKETDDLALVADDALTLAKQLGNDQVLVVLDLDNTLLAMEQGLGSDHWYDWQVEMKKEDPCSAQLVGDLLAVQGALYFASAMRPTQEDAAAQIRRMQDHGLNVFILTSRGAEFRLHTFRELRRNGFSFYSSAIGPMGGYPETFVPEGGSRPARYEDGVFMTAGQHKGNMLKALLNKTATPYPTMIVMADDKARNLQAVMDAFNAMDIAVHAWRYAGEDEARVAYDPLQATREWEQIRPALQQIQVLMGPDNFDFPPYAHPEGCTAPE
jgi:hypothetical protein